MEDGTAVQVSPLIKVARYTVLLVGVIYGKKRYDSLKPYAEDERLVETEKKIKSEEAIQIANELATANADTILKSILIQSPSLASQEHKNVQSDFSLKIHTVP
ncbi:LOW QUALITY PROTEIN: ATP synthase subunit e, mitochondrial [Pelobates fuscus]|uniref:LOW QUALITY PROTEIN: ATP synthase subunit e, mitochondrial n=1 Tax=Pelobates fuscus TaxID=191477 RepID=UPI002FE478C8